jgi:hypothetical protein
MKFDQIQINSIQNLILEHTSIQKMQAGMNAIINYKSLN